MKEGPSQPPITLDCPPPIRWLQSHSIDIKLCSAQTLAPSLPTPPPGRRLSSTARAAAQIPSPPIPPGGSFSSTASAQRRPVEASANGGWVRRQPPLPPLPHGLASGHPRRLPRLPLPEATAAAGAGHRGLACTRFGCRGPVSGRHRPRSMAAEPRAQQHHLHCCQDNVAANAPRSPLPYSPVAGGHAQHPLHLLRQAGPCLPHRSQPRLSSVLNIP